MFENQNLFNKTEMETQDPVQESCTAVEKLIEKMKKDSKFLRTNDPDGKEIITSPEGKQFEIKRIMDPGDPDIQKIHAFLKETFTPEEADSLETIQNAIKTNWGAYHLVKDGEENIVAHSCVGYLNINQEPSQTDPKEGELFVGYIITKPEHRKSGIAKELYQNVYQYAIQEAKNRKSVIKAIVGEAVEKIEPLLNRLERKRIYFEDEQGNIKEVPYICPPIDWDAKTGEPLTGPSKKHLMIKMVDGREWLAKEELIKMIDAIYRENYAFPSSFKNKEAFLKSRNIVLGYVAALEKALSGAKNGKIFTISAEEKKRKRQELEANGKKLIEIVKGENE